MIGRSAPSSIGFSAAVNASQKNVAFTRVDPPLSSA
jgi:hypothetical protein